MKKFIATFCLTSLTLTSYAANTPDKCNQLATWKEQLKCVMDYADSLPRPRFSDQNLKQNITLVDNALDKVVQINGVSFEWRSNNQKDIGVIAQNVEQVFPELVSTSPKTGFKQVNYAGLLGVLIESVKELKRENEALRQELGL
ncbi:tail fiber domain-containing protein [Endozoicomonas sp. SM1973]|uniref:Tail fiber domain-containing protein n=1 Tax=Spartinivicinus marinus TaxID=2994442 RepID=A0A853IGP0_9GAMM|nr:tail fiber domain-containing protein [Spartinivicinus marinus]MCX4026929.1 tail fiber domain-containing protein [Spartinivicinus marinus]NYZ66726.1 tail fiber domain-containing protein [Spartinivicinus marinus]